MNRTRFTAEFMKKHKKLIRDNKPNRFITKYGVTLKNGNLYSDDKRIVPESQVQTVLERTTKGNGPLGIRSLQAYIQYRVWGVTRSDIKDFLQSNETLQAIAVRPPTRNVNRADKPKEGTTSFVLHKYPNTIGVDLIKISTVMFRDKAYYGKSTHIFVAVHKRSLFIWAYHIPAPNSKQAAKSMKIVLEECKQKFGACGHVEKDAGAEFKGVFSAMMKRRNIRQTVLDLVSYVEKANSTLQRYIAFLADSEPFTRAVAKAVKKMRNIKSRVTGMTSLSFVNSQVNVNRIHRKYKGGHKKIRTFQVGDSVRYLLKDAQREKAILYKSYEGAGTKKKWSQNYAISHKKGKKYKVNGKWRKNIDLMLAMDVRMEEKRPIPPVKKKAMVLRSGKRLKPRKS